MVILLCGMIASGKGTFAHMLAKKGAVVINDDSFVLALHSQDYTLYQKELKYVYKTAEHSTLIAALHLGIDIVIDRPNFRKSTRRRYIGMAQAFDMPVVGVVFPKESPLVHATRRFEADPRGKSLEHWIEAATRHHAEWEDPQIEEGFDNIIPAKTAIEMVQSDSW